MKHFPLCCWHFDMSEAPGKVSSIVITIYRDFCLGIVEFIFWKIKCPYFFFKWWKSCYSFGFRLRDPRDDDLSHHEEKSCHLDFVIETCTAMIGTRPFLPSFWPLQHTLRQNNQRLKKIQKLKFFYLKILDKITSFWREKKITFFEMMILGFVSVCNSSHSIFGFAQQHKLLGWQQSSCCNRDFQSLLLPLLNLSRNFQWHF